MKIIDFSKNLKQKVVLCLGFFDGLHLGHQAIVSEGKSLASELDASCYIFTFDDKFSRLVKDKKSIFTLDERLAVFKTSGADCAVVASADSDFLSQTKVEFLDLITRKFNLVGVVCGYDYTFGVKGLGNVKFLSEYLKDKGITLKVVDDFYLTGEKVSSSLIKSYLEKGNIVRANQLFGYEYFSLSKVVNGKNVGQMLGFPTMNTFFPLTKKPLKMGVYKTTTEIDGKIYRSITNFGNAPTFDRNNLIVETHVLSFSGDLYGKMVKIRFIEYLRDIVKFSSIDALVKQIEEDIKRV